MKIQLRKIERENTLIVTDKQNKLQIISCLKYFFLQ